MLESSIFQNGNYAHYDKEKNYKVDCIKQH